MTPYRDTGRSRILLSALGNKIEGVYLDGIQYSANMVANFAETFSARKGTPVYLGAAGSTPAYFLQPGQTISGNTQATWDFQFSIQPGAPQPQQLNVPMRATALASSPTGPAANAVYTFIPIHIANEAVGMSFEYKMDGAATDDFMTMGIGTENDYTMEAKFVDDGQWNGAPVLEVSDFHDQDVQLAFALNGSNGPPAGMLSVRNIHGSYVAERGEMRYKLLLLNEKPL